MPICNLLFAILCNLFFCQYCRLIFLIYFGNIFSLVFLQLIFCYSLQFIFCQSCRLIFLKFFENIFLANQADFFVNWVCVNLLFGQKYIISFIPWKSKKSLQIMVKPSKPWGKFTDPFDLVYFVKMSCRWGDLFMITYVPYRHTHR